MPDADRKQERSRLIDHFKRVHAIIVGLSITEAVRHLFPLDPDTLGRPSIWLFVAFFFTVVPIFHGGDRSLDIKYLNEPRETLPQRIGYLWDVYILLLTAILFVAIAESIPGPPNPAAAGAAAATGAMFKDCQVFFALMSGTLAFDVAVLVIDRVKSAGLAKDRLSPYPWWISINAVMAAMCAGAAVAVHAPAAAGTGTVLGVAVPLLVVAPLIALLSIARTMIDYVVGGDFLFP